MALILLLLDFSCSLIPLSRPLMQCHTPASFSPWSPASLYVYLRLSRSCSSGPRLSSSRKDYIKTSRNEYPWTSIDMSQTLFLPSVETGANPSTKESWIEVQWTDGQLSRITLLNAPIASNLSSWSIYTKSRVSVYISSASPRALPCAAGQSTATSSSPVIAYPSLFALQQPGHGL